MPRCYYHLYRSCFRHFQRVRKSCQHSHYCYQCYYYFLRKQSYKYEVLHQLKVSLHDPKLELIELQWALFALIFVFFIFFVSSKILVISYKCLFCYLIWIISLIIIINLAILYLILILFQLVFLLIVTSSLWHSSSWYFH